MKRRSRGGFTLMELLMTVLVASLVAMAMAVGVAAAMRTYHQSVEHSRVKTLTATLSQAVTDELHYALNVRTDDSGGLAFDSTAFGPGCSLDANADGRLLLTNQDGTARELISEGAYGRLSANITLSYDGTLFTAELTIENDGGTQLESQSLTVRPLNER